MRIALLAAACLILAPAAGAARLSHEEPSLNAVASAISEQPVKVYCWVNDGSDLDADAGAWGYVNLFDTVIYLDPRPCAGALALQSGAMEPLWELGLGALVLSHEAYHLKLTLPVWRRGDEGQTECRAVKRIPQTLLDLGASQSIADAVLPWALAAHYKISTFDDYDYPSCRVPGFDWWPRS